MSHMEKDMDRWLKVSKMLTELELYYFIVGKSNITARIFNTGNTKCQELKTIKGLQQVSK